METAPARFAALADALSGEPGMVVGGGRRGFGSDALTVEGRIFAMVSDGRLVLKLPADRVAGLIADGRGIAFDAGKGRPMKEWVGLADGPDVPWLDLGREALGFVSGGSRRR